NSLVNDIISPVIGLFASADMSAWSVMIGGAEIRYGAFLTAIINFLIMALVIFLLVKILNRIMAMGKKPEPKAEPTTKKCPFCCSEIAIEATRCPHCTSELEK
ncbi:MAG: MscL family protein, partial [Oscillospiraceae bacterium]|nr:MscL family protein [Oscillospiraceae bacterium]